jgi:hypothetical protein
MAQPCDHNCPARIKFEYDKFQDKQVEIKIDKSEKNGLKMRIRIKDEYSLNGIEIENVIKEVLINQELVIDIDHVESLKVLDQI